MNALSAAVPLGAGISSGISSLSSAALRAGIGDGAAASGGRSKPMKKRRISESPCNDTNMMDSTTASNGHNHGPHGALLGQLFGSSNTSTTDEPNFVSQSSSSSQDTHNANMTFSRGNSEYSAANEEKHTASSTPITESVHETNGSKFDDEDGHYSAASVLLGLMGR